MSKPFRFASAASLAALASMIAGCAVPQGHAASASGFGGKADGDIGLATRALAALNSNDVPMAISFAERAVESTPDDAGFRALLGNAYFAGGRFASAEAAYKDALAIYSNQPQVVVKLALVEIAQGKQAEAAAFLNAARGVLDASNYGLALTLAGRAGDAVAVLEAAARAPGADARVRQNLALAYAFSGNWTEARTVAAQDVPANQLDQRLQQWMQLAKPAHAFDQVAALTGVKPAASDPGQPVRLALHKTDTRQADAAPVAQPQPQVQAQVAEAAPAMVVAPSAALPQPVEAAPVPPQVAEAAAPPAPPPHDPARVAAPEPAPAVMAVAAAAAMAPEAPAAFAALAPKIAAPRPHRAAAPAKRAAVHAAAKHRGNSNAVLQLGAYGSRERVAVAWDRLTKRYPALRAYLPMTARFASPKGMVYRLSVQGFDSQREAIARCNQLKNNGGSCFVRGFAGDAPVEIAAR